MASLFTQQDSWPSGDGIGVTSTTPATDLPQEQIDAIIKTKRKAREPKACYPCHARKVKCDRNFPCDGCVKRDHADLCSYERPPKKRQATAAAIPADRINEFSETTIPSVESSVSQIKPEKAENSIADNDLNERIVVPRQQWNLVCNQLKEMEDAISTLRSSMKEMENSPSPNAGEPDSIQRCDPNQASTRTSPEREGIHTTHTYGEGTVHLGSRSVLAYILNKSGSQQAQALLEGGILPKLGLDNETATYPFVDLWSSDSSSFDINAICSALPSDQQILE